MIKSVLKKKNSPVLCGIKTMEWRDMRSGYINGLNSTCQKFISTCNFRMGPYLGVRSWQMWLRSGLRWDLIELGWSLNLMRNSLYKTEKDRENKVTWRWRQRLEWCIYKTSKANNCWQLQKLGERHGLVSPQSPQKELTLRTPWFQTSGSWTVRFKKKKICCFEATKFVMALVWQPKETHREINQRVTTLF